MWYCTDSRSFSATNKLCTCSVQDLNYEHICFLFPILSILYDIHTVQFDCHENPSLIYYLVFMYVYLNCRALYQVSLLVQSTWSLAWGPVLGRPLSPTPIYPSSRSPEAPLSESAYNATLLTIVRSSHLRYTATCMRICGFSLWEQNLIPHWLYSFFQL